MIRITVELLPHGSEERRRTLGTATIINDGSGTWDTGNYRAEVKGARAVRRCAVLGFPRLRQDAWALLLRVLLASLPKRIVRQAVREWSEAEKAQGE